jgi:2-amino-4-hydroxy-6-hydroxymethyldihydropteridine diphosphokinase
LNIVVLGLGTNLGNRWQNLRNALYYLEVFVGETQKVSPVYQTKAFGFDGNDFLNAVLVLQTNLSPAELLQKTRKIEKLLGRRSKSINGQYSNRLIDIDILYYNDIVLKTKDLQIPHSQIQFRNFVLQPLVDILPDFFHPELQKTHKELLTLSSDKNKAEKQDKKLETIKQIPYNFIAIEGNIGAGKTTFSKQFAADFNAKLVLERFEENPFLPKFYEDAKRYAFPLEMSFLADRYQQLSDDLAQYDLFKTSVISDYYVFKSLIFSKVTLTDDEYVLYRKIFNFMYNDLVKPDLYIYLYQNVEKLLENIKKRGREYEKTIKAEYLTQIHEGYMNFIKTQKNLNVLILDISDVDFVQQPEYYHKMVQIILNHSVAEDRLVIKKI